MLADIQAALDTGVSVYAFARERSMSPSTIYLRIRNRGLKANTIKEAA